MKILLTAVSLFLFSFQPANTDEWKGWRGLHRQACGDTTAVPFEWTETKNIAWSLDIEGEGHSSPVVSKEYVFITSASFDENGNTFYTILTDVIMILLIILVLIKLIHGFKSLIINNKLTKRKLISELSVFCFYGLVIFILYILHWMHSDENSTQPERILITYIFSGSVFLLSLLFLSKIFSVNSVFRILIGLLILFLEAALIKYLPLQDYYTVSDFFQVWSILLTIPAIILPVIFSAFLVIKTIIVRMKNLSVEEDGSGKLLNKIYSKRCRIILAIVAFIAGLSGFLSIPAIVVAKSLAGDYLTGIQESLQFRSIFNPGAAYPYFLGVLITGFLLWILIEGNKSGSRRNQFTIYPVILVLSFLFFILDNFAVESPEYRRIITCIDRETGKINWKKDYLAGPASQCSNFNSQATPTPVINDNSVYACFGSAGLVSADFDGRFKWENKDMAFESIHGAGSSPIISGDGIIILCSSAKNSYLTSLDFDTGTQNWKTDLKSYEGAGGEYRTPILYNHNGMEFIIEWSPARNEIVFYDARTGAPSKTYNPEWEFAGESIITPVVGEGILYLASQINVVALDINSLFAEKPPVIWSTDLEGKGPNTSSPVLSSGMLFMVSDNGDAVCINSVTGKILWQEKLPGTYFSSPVVSANKVYFSNTAGMTTVTECSAGYNRIAVNKLPEGIYSTLVPIGGQLFIRTKNKLWCLK